MRRTWFISAGIAVVGLLAGVGIAGRPLASDSFIIGAAATSSSATSDSQAPASTGVPPTADVTSTVQSVSTVADTTTDPASTTSTIPSTTSSTVEPAPTTAPPTSAPPTSAGPPVDQTLDRADVRLVIANGDGRFNLAGVNASRLEQAGYVTIDLEDTPPVPATILYYRPGFDDEAAIVAADLLVPQAILAPLPDTPVTLNDQNGDIVVVLGPDALR